MPSSERLSNERSASNDSFFFLKRSNSTKSLFDELLGTSSSTSIVKKNLKSMMKFPPGLLNAKELRDSIGPITYPYSMAPLVPNLIEFDGSGIKLNQDLEKVMCIMKEGLVLQKVTRRKKKDYLFKLERNKYITWKDGLKRLDLDSIKSIRPGELGSNYREEYNIDAKFSKYWITIIYKFANKLKALHVIAKDEMDYNVFCSTLFGLVRTRRELMESMAVPDHEKFANIHWRREVSKNKEDEIKDKLSFDDVRKLCHKFHIYCSTKYLRQFFNQADINGNGLLNFEEFQIFVKLLKSRREIDEIWNEIAKKSNSLTFEDFYEFLQEKQGESVSITEAQTLFEKYQDPDNNIIDRKGFSRYLNSVPYLKSNSEDFSKPLNHYFIASSHNTYLTGKQIGGSPSVEGYIQALQQGCRCVEIDIWDGENGPVVCHGILTSALPLRTVTDTVRKYAFLASPFPLIISIEVRCDSKNQRIAASIFKECFGVLLYFADDRRPTLPSPLELRHRVVLKIKKTKNYEDGAMLTSVTSSSSSSRSSSYESGDMYNKKRGSRIRRFSFNKRQLPIVDEFYELTGLQGLKFRNFSLCESKGTNHCFSLNEKKIDRMIRDPNMRASINKHNRRYMMRVYPHALRYNSTNFNPMRYWKLGVQMVATNWQTNDLGHQLNVAMFQLNSRTPQVGYLLKPASIASVVNKTRELDIIAKQNQSPERYNIQVISAQLLPNVSYTMDVDGDQGLFREDNICTHVECEIISSDDVRVSSLANAAVQVQPMAHNGATPESGYAVVTGRRCYENGFNPIWNVSFTVELAKSDVPFTFLRVVVKEHSSTLAMTCVPLDRVRMGYRHIPLYSTEGEQYIFSTLFVSLQRQI
ncbi:1-phosphatidylinositol 4,5-bisphosphate phosphodiesterase 1 [Nakaseomyces bracarensis]|uniref:Phosphoinositide phospholipase C n=1 Tax=Nakaseomyces bracarensis TaxID=273131 RepID=A0ABR4NS78_9SACH